MGRCQNRLCGDPGRVIERIDAIASYADGLRSRILAFKEQNKHGWATIFGRILVGHLDANYRSADVDLIVANPTHSSRVPRHTEQVIERASAEDLLDTWPWDDQRSPALLKGKATTGSGTSGATLAQKRAAAEEVEAALVIPDPSRVASKRIIVYDDICTTGYQLNAVAKKLREVGAISVSAIVLARTPWRG